MSAAEGSYGYDGSLRSEAELGEFAQFVRLLNMYAHANGPLHVTSREHDFQYEGWFDDDEDRHKRGVKINGFSGWPVLHPHQKLTLFIFIPVMCLLSNLILFPMLSYPLDVLAYFLGNFLFCVIVLTNMAGSLTQSADPAVFGCKRWTAREYLLYLRIKYETHKYGDRAGTLVIPDVGPAWERPLFEFRDEKGIMLEEIEKLIDAHPHSQQVREALPIVDRADRIKLFLKVQSGEETKPVYPKRRWDATDHVMVQHNSYHCHSTNKSVLLHDHFCVWLNSAVGKNNLKYFRAFIQTIFWFDTILCIGSIVVLVDSGLDEFEFKVRMENMFPRCNPTIALGFCRAGLSMLILMCGALLYQMVWLNSFHLMLFLLGDEKAHTTQHYWHTTGEDPAKAGQQEQ